MTNLILSLLRHMRSVLLPKNSNRELLARWGLRAYSRLLTLERENIETGKSASGSLVRPRLRHKISFFLINEDFQYRTNVNYYCPSLPNMSCLHPVGVGGVARQSVDFPETFANDVRAGSSAVAQAGREGVFWTDRGFCACKWAQVCLKLGWNYAIRAACNTYPTLPDGRSGRIDAFVFSGCTRYFQNVWLTQDKKLRTNLSVTWTIDKHGQTEMVALTFNQTARHARWREYSYRMRIKQNFHDDKLGGFDMEHIQLQHAERIERLLLAMAVATLWCHELGEHVLQQGETARCPIDPGPTPELSLFQLGLRWLKGAVTVALRLLPKYQSQLSNLNLQPV